MDRCRAVSRSNLEIRSAVGEADRRQATDLPAVCLFDETAISQDSKEFTLFATIDPDTRPILHAAVAPTRDYLTRWQFFEELGELYGRMPPIVVTDRVGYGPAFT